MNIRWTKDGRDEGRFWYYKNTRLRLSKGPSQYYVWCGQRAVAEGKTKAIVEKNLKDFLAEVEAGKRTLG